MQKIIDVDVHEYLPSISSLVPFLEPKWQKYINVYRWNGVNTDWPYASTSSGGGKRLDSYLDDGGPPGSDLGVMQKQLLDKEKITYGVLTGFSHFSAMLGWYDFATALCSAYNDWQIKEWLEQDDRLLGSIHIATQSPLDAAKEIDRLGEHPQMVQVFIPLVTGQRADLGDPFYRPIFEAANRNNLAVAFHHGTHTKTVFGYPQYYIQWHSLIPQASMAQLTSLVFSGLFDEYPDLRVTLLEASYSWVPYLMRRLDQQYRQLRIEVPWVKKMPSEHIRNNIKVATQPVEDISTQDFMRLIDMMGTDKMIMFATDYPHWDFDSPTRALPGGLQEEIKQKILYKNAAEFYKIQI